MGESRLATPDGHLSLGRALPGTVHAASASSFPFQTMHARASRTTPLLSSRDAVPPKVPARVDVLSSHDGGASWGLAAAVNGMYWANLFLHDGAVYLLGTGGVGGGAIAIARSDDNGSTWRSAELFRQPGPAVGSYATGATPVLAAQGRLWRAFELWRAPHRWARGARTLRNLSVSQHVSCCCVQGILTAVLSITSAYAVALAALTACRYTASWATDERYAVQIAGGRRTLRRCSSQQRRAPTCWNPGRGP